MNKRQSKLWQMFFTRLAPQSGNNLFRIIPCILSFRPISAVLLSLGRPDWVAPIGQQYHGRGAEVEDGKQESEHEAHGIDSC